MKNNQQIEHSVFLRKLEPEDLPLLYQWENDASVWADGDTHNPLSQNDLRDYIMRTTGDMFLDGQLRMIVCQASTNESEGSFATSGEAMGCVDLYDVDIRNRKVAVAVYVAPQFRNKGVAREALLQIKSYVAEFLGFRMLYAWVRVGNVASEKAFKATGFSEVARLPKWINEGDVCILQTQL